MALRVVITIWASLAGFIIFVKLHDLFSESYPYIRHYLSVAGNADVLRRSLPYHKQGIDIREMLPPGACVEAAFPTKNVTLEEITFRYELFPIKSINTWPNIFNNSQHRCNGIYHVDLQKPLRHKIFSERYPHYSIFFGYLFMSVMSAVAGMAVYAWIVPGVVFKGFWQNLGAMYILGAVVLGLMYWLVLLFGLPLSRDIFVILWAPFLWRAVLFWRRRTKQRITVPVSKNIDPVTIGLKIITIGLSLYFVLYAVSFPISIWDEVYIWLLKAKVFYQAHGFAFDYTAYDHNYYPVLWPLYIGLQYVLIGGAYDEVAKWTSATIFIALLSQISLIAQELGMGRRIQWLAIFIYLSCLYHWTMFTALPENFYIALTAMSFIFLLRFIKTGEQGWFSLLFITLLGLSALKVEGILVAVLCYVAVIVRGHKTVPLKRLFMKPSGLLLVCFTPLLWQTWLVWQHVPFGVFHLQMVVSPGSIVRVLEVAVLFVFQWPNWAVIFLASAPLLMVSRNRGWHPNEQMLLVYCLGLAVFSLLAGLFWRKEVFIYYPEVLTRLFARAVPFILLLWMSRLTALKMERTVK